MTYQVVLFPGDGIGPEVVDAAVRVLDAVADANGLPIAYSPLPIGGAAIDQYGVPLRQEDLERCRTADAVLLGAVGGPAWDRLPVETRPERGLLQLRKELNLCINLRVVRATAAGSSASPLKEEVARETDIAFVRELTAGIYFGRPSHVQGAAPDREAVDTATYTESQIVAVLDYAYALARSRRGKVVSVDKANVMQTSRLWRQVASEYAAAHPDVTLEHALVDSFAMSLMQNPRRYDVVVTDNLFGDILTDLAGVIAGSLGLLPSASLQAGGSGRRFGLYEPVHGSAPDIAGQGVANPVGCILSIALMLEWSFGRPDLARAIRDGVDAVMAAGRLTRDLAASPETAVSTQQFVDAVLVYLGEEGYIRGDRALRHHVA